MSCIARLVSLNEVGGDPGRFGTTLDDFPRWCADTQEDHPHTLLATSTHDTKWSEDVRSRIRLLSEIPCEWADAVREWSRVNARYRTGDLPDRRTEYLLYQTLLGAWLISRVRLLEYMKRWKNSSFRFSKTRRSDPRLNRFWNRWSRRPA